ncbi:MAG TPA: hypothetical protein VF777_00915 [Phycisphaerales bacterium]
MGFELSPIPSGDRDVSDSGGSKSGNIGTDAGPPMPPATPTVPTDPDLAAVVAAWSELPQPIRVAVLALVQAAGGRPNP